MKIVLLIIMMSFMLGGSVTLVCRPNRKNEKFKVKLADKYIEKIKKLPDGSKITYPEIIFALYEEIKRRDIKALYNVVSDYAQLTPGQLFTQGTDTVFDLDFTKTNGTLMVKANKQPIVFNGQFPVYANQDGIKSFSFTQADLGYIAMAQIKVQGNGPYLDFGDANGQLKIKIVIYNDEIKAKYGEIKQKIDEKIKGLLESERTLIVDPISEIMYLIIINRFISDLLDLIKKDQLENLDSLLDLYLAPLIKLTDIQSFEICIGGML